MLILTPPECQSPLPFQPTHTCQSRKDFVIICETTVRRSKSPSSGGVFPPFNCTSLLIIMRPRSPLRQTRPFYSEQARPKSRYIVVVVVVGGGVDGVAIGVLFSDEFKGECKKTNGESWRENKAKPGSWQTIDLVDIKS